MNPCVHAPYTQVCEIFIYLIQWRTRGGILLGPKYLGMGIPAWNIVLGARGPICNLLHFLEVKKTPRNGTFIAIKVRVTVNDTVIRYAGVGK